MRPTPLHRHQLARLAPAGWQRVLERDWDAGARECLTHWAAHGLPLVITRQPSMPASTDGIAMGLPAPGRWGRRRFAMQVQRADVSYFDEFPRLDQLLRRLPEALRPAMQGLCDGLEGAGVVARVHGSYGWRHLTGLDHVRAGSDVDLCIAVADESQADWAATLLQASPCRRARLDGELVFSDGSAVAWREWLAWRSGRAQAMLVKRLDGCSLVHELPRQPLACRAEAMA
jgi:phosphoribosyl-dephospho-CoA transferase